MSQPHTFEFNSDEYTVENPESAESWIACLSQFIEDFSERHYPTRWQGDRSGISEDSIQDVAAVVPLAIKEYRSMTDEQEAKQSFRSVLLWKLTEKFQEDDHMDYVTQSIYEGGFSGIFEDLVNILSDVDGPVVDEDELRDGLLAAIEEKMQDLDDSDVFDYLGNPEVPLSFSPMHNSVPVSGKSYSCDDLMIHPEAFGGHGPSVEIDGLAKLLRMNTRALMPFMSIDYKDDEKIRAWMKYTFDIEEGLPPVISKEKLQDLMDNCGSTYAYPEWIGCIYLEHLAKLDPSKPMKLTQGVIGFMDVVNGAGHTVELDEGAFIIVHPHECLDREPGSYNLQSITGDRPEAGIENCNVEGLKAAFKNQMESEKNSSRRVENALEL